MGLHKGQTNNPAGRPKGSKSKSGEELRELILAFIDRNMPSIQENYDLLEPKDKLAFLEKLFSFGLPKMQAVRMEVENFIPPMVIQLSGSAEDQERQKKLLEEVEAKLNAIDGEP